MTQKSVFLCFFISVFTQSQKYDFALFEETFLQVGHRS